MPAPHAPLPLHAAADLQDHLLSAMHDLDRLQTLLGGACDTLLAGFRGANERIHELESDVAETAFRHIAQHLGSAVVALQFHDMASQLIAHTRQRLSSCADRLARDSFAFDEALIEELPQRPNPVTQAEMDAGSVTLF